jgi:L-alanine-DL-glutamate epimerase-like enolase superfamily enzyme
LSYSKEIEFKQKPSLKGREITGATIYRLKIPLNMAFTISLGSTDFYDAVVVELRFSDIIGYGEAETVQQITGETPEVLFDVSAGILASMEGQSFESVEDVSLFITSFCHGNNAAKSAVDMAFHDALGKMHGISVADLLGGSMRPRITSFTIPIGDVNENLKLLDRYQKAGARIIKVKVGKSATKDAERLTVIAGKLDDGVTFFADANQGYRLTDAVKISEILYRNEALFFEQPMIRNDLVAFRNLRRKAGIPIMLDESISSPKDVLDAVCADAADMVNVKLSKSGGIRNAVKTLVAAQAAGLDAMVGCMLESKLGIAASLAVANAVNNVKYTDLDGFTYLTEQPFDGGVELRSGTDYPVDGAGLAVKRNKDIGQLNF